MEATSWRHGRNGSGNTYPAAQLPQTGQVTDDGVPFLFVNGSEGTPNNVIGATIPLPAGKYTTLHVLGAADTVNSDGKITVTYVDGSVELPLQLTGWRNAAAFGESEAVTTNLMHAKTGIRSVKLAIFHQKIPLDPAREVASISVPSAVTPRPHLFAVTLEKESHDRVRVDGHGSARRPSRSTPTARRQRAPAC